MTSRNVQSNFAMHHVFWVGVLVAGALAFLCGVSTAHFARPALVAMLLVLMASIEYFPIRTKKTTFTLALPILFTVAAVTGFGAAIVGNSLVVGIVLVTRRNPWREVCLQVSIRVLKLTVAWVMTAMFLPQPPHKSLSYWILRLLIFATAVSVTGGLFSYLQLKLEHVPWLRLREIAIRTFVPFFVTILYDSLMLWLVSSPKNTQSGELGTLFFYLPLVIGNLVIHLFSNLVKTNRSLQRMVDLSERMKRHTGVPLLLQQIVEAVSSIILADWCAIYVLDEAGQFRMGPAHGRAIEIDEVSVNDFARSLPNHEQALQIHRVRTGSVYTTVIVSSLFADGMLVGVLAVGRRRPLNVKPDEVRILEIYTAHAGVALNQAQYLQEREKRLIVEERNRLAREIHDGLAQDLAGTLLQLEGLKRKVAATGVLPLIVDLQTTLQRTVQTVRDSIFSLRPEPWMQMGLIPAIRDHLSKFEAKSDLTIHFEVQTAVLDVPSLKVAKIVYSTLVECIHNTVKHANATTIIVTLTETADVIRFTLEDDGQGFDFGKAIMNSRQKQSFGIENLYELANQVQATLEFETAVGQGTKVILEIPRKEEYSDGETTYFAL